MKDSNLEKLYEKVETLQFHQQLMLMMLGDVKDQLYVLIIKKNLSKQEAEELLELCENVSKEYKKQKAEGFLNFNPLLQELNNKMNSKITIKELVEACRKQGVYTEVMNEFHSKFV
ncbi:DUF1878 family protein [Peribacillus alkalitolerans]|uniref:DUF1878 family protein n=1 Tax=Peribacillus alkalitolerans TaxID=1550385 RepID=UPI0013CFEC84|nr:DUF1878 family protein [Peribacillus alkalitolerans]